MGGSTSLKASAQLFYFLTQKYFRCFGRSGFRGFHAKGADEFAKGAKVSLISFL